MTQENTQDIVFELISVKKQKNCITPIANQLKKLNKNLSLTISDNLSSLEEKRRRHWIIAQNESNNSEELWEIYLALAPNQIELFQRRREMIESKFLTLKEE